MTWDLEGVVQLDRSGPIPRIALDTSPVRVLSDIRWEDIVGCWLVRLELDRAAKRWVDCTELVVELLVVRYWGPFWRVRPDDTYWPSVERYGLGVTSLTAQAASTARQRRTQLNLQIGAALTHERGNHGSVIRTRKKGR